jgi:peptidyl-prolyl cis-trans isomerase C
MKKFAYPWNVALGLVATLLTPIVLGGAAVLFAVKVTVLPADAAFRAYGTVVTRAELEHRLGVLKALYGIAPPSDPAKLDAYHRQSAEAVAVSTVLDHAARAQGIVIEEKDARDQLGQLIGWRFPDGMTGFARLLGQVGASEKDVVDEISRQKAVALLFDKVEAMPPGPVAPATEGDARTYYDQHPAAFAQPVIRHLRNIVVATRSDADDVVNQLRAGADFAQTAQRTSLDQSTRDAGGDLGFVARDQLEDPVAGPAFSTAVGGVFGPVQATHGWNVGQALEERPAGMPSFEQVEPELVTELTSARKAGRWREWVREQMRQADITYADDLAPVTSGNVPGPASEPASGAAGPPAAQAEPPAGPERR